MYRCVYGRCSNINILFVFSNEKLVYRAGIHNILVNITNREDPVQTDSLEMVLSWVGTVLLGLFDRQVVFEI